MDFDNEMLDSEDKKNQLRKARVRFAVRRHRSVLSKSDKEKIKAKDRERKAAMMSRMSDADRERKREKDRQRKAAQRAKQKEICGSNNDEDDDNELEKPPSYLANERENNRQYKIRMREARSEEEAEYDRIKLVLINRESRSKYSEDQQHDMRTGAAEGMRKFRELGFLKEYKERSKRSKDTLEIWRSFWRSGEDARVLLETKEPAIAEKLANEVDVDVSEEFSSKSMDDEERIKEWRKKNAEKVKAWRRKKRMEILKKLNEPIILPEMEKSEYEKIRDKNIEELRKARKAFGL